MAEKSVDPLIVGSVLHRINVERMQAKTIDDIVRLLDEASFDLERQIADAPLVSARRERLVALLRDLKASRAELYISLEEKLTEDLVDFSKYEVEFQEGFYKGLGGTNWVFGRPSAKVLRELVTNEPMSGEYLKGWVDKLERDELFKINQQIRLGIVEGENPKDIAKRVVGYKDKDGVVVGTKRNATMLARTAYTSVQARAEIEFLLANPDLFEEYVWISVLDERTCVDPTTLVMTPTGMVHVGTLREGDLILGGSRQFRRVNATMRKRVPRHAVVTLSNGEKIKCTTDHLFLTEFGWMQAEDLSTGTKLKIKL